ncbi:MAG: hypothetical protein J4F36_00290 [Nitrosopumilaceae archaeon]|nr:hypothetical protein [Nitrosopumilaceae archaeon]
MKTRTKIIIPVIAFLAIGLFYAFITANGFSFYDEGISLILYSDYQLQEFQSNSVDQDFPITKITDDDLKDTPELKNLIEKALSEEYPLNRVGRVPISFEELDNFHHQYAEILAAKYSRNSTDYFTVDKQHMPEKYLAISPSTHLRTFEGSYFEYDGQQYGIQPNRIYIPFVEEEDHLHLEVYKTNGSLREKDHTWADLSDKQIELEPQIVSAIDNIGKQQENIEVFSFGLSPATVTKHENWKVNTLDGFLFEYKDKVFSIGFWIA